MAKKATKPKRYMDKQQGRRFLLELCGLLRSTDIPFFLVQGTALGAYRDRGFTPTELDIDIGFLAEHFVPNAHRLASYLILSGFEIKTINLPFTRCRTMVVWKYGVHADLVSFVKWQDVRFVTRPVDHRKLEPYSIVHNAAMIEQTTAVKLFDSVFQVPHPIEDYLRLEYGPEWHTPKEDHVSRTRIYGFVKEQGIPHDILDSLA